jgi:Ca2+-binding RTX toxin-like protein
MNKPLVAVAALAMLGSPILLAVGPASAAVPSDLTVDFTGEPAAWVANGYSTASSPDVKFYDTGGSGNLLVTDYGNQSHGQAIASFSGATEIRLTNPSTHISLAFGDDDPGFLDGTAQARLIAYRGATKVGQTLKNVNANDVMDQTISFQNKLFNRVVFEYVDAAEVPVPNLPEIVDDVQVGALCTIVGTANNDTLTGTAGSDVICGDTGVDRIRGLGGDDLILSGGGADIAHGDGGNDKVNGGDQRDRIFGDAGNDVLGGGKKKDTCVGGAGHDSGSTCEVKRSIP